MDSIEIIAAHCSWLTFIRLFGKPDVPTEFGVRNKSPNAASHTEEICRKAEDKGIWALEWVIYTDNHLRYITQIIPRFMVLNGGASPPCRIPITPYGRVGYQDEIIDGNDVRAIIDEWDVYYTPRKYRLEVATRQLVQEGDALTSGDMIRMDALAKPHMLEPKAD